MREYIVDTFGIVQDFADLHENMNTPLYQAIMNVMVPRQREEIVRCRDCKYINHHEYNNGIKYQTCSYFDSEFVEVEPDGFCKWGERRA